MKAAPCGHESFSRSDGARNTADQMNSLGLYSNRCMTLSKPLTALDLCFHICKMDTAASSGARDRFAPDPRTTSVSLSQATAGAQPLRALAEAGEGETHLAFPLGRLQM